MTDPQQKTHPTERPIVSRPLAIILALLLVIQLRTDRGEDTNTGQWSTAQGLRLVAQVHDLIRARSYHTPTNERLFQAAIDGMLRTVDRHSSYLPPLTARRLDRDIRDRAQGLIGILHMFAPGQGMRIIEVLPDFPAERAGIKKGDFIVRANGIDLTKLDYLTCLKLLSGTPGKDAHLTIRHQGIDRDVVLTRKAFYPQQVRFNHLLTQDKRLGYARLSMFNVNAAPYVRREIETLKREGMQALIFDLRGNGGGELTAGTSVADLFLPVGSLITIIERRASGMSEVIKKIQKKKIIATKKFLGNFPLVILVNRYTASAAELVTSSLQDNGRAIIVGERTYGKARIQEVHPLDQGILGEVRITTGRYLTPKGRDLEGLPSSPDHGVKPNVAVSLTQSESEAISRFMRMREMGFPMPNQRAPNDPQLNRAVKILQEKLARGNSAAAKKKAPQP